MPGWNECSIYDIACRNKTCDHPTNKPRKAVTVSQRIIDIVTDRGIPFRVVYENRVYRNGEIAAFPTVAFYDTRYDIDAHGQFVSDFSAETLLERQNGYPLDLDGGQPNWQIDGSAMALVKMWLVHVFLAR